jgi:hypothetical protein
MLNKKYMADVRMPAGPAPKGKSKKMPSMADEGGETDSDDEYAGEPAEGGDDDMADLFGDDSGDDAGDDMGADLSTASDDDLLAEARKRGLSLDAPKPAPGKGRLGASDGEADDDEIN